MKTIYNWFLTAVFTLVATAAFSQGVTTSALGGKVTDNVGEPLAGANVVAIHVPSGTKYGAVTDFDGLYRISNMRVGGPYTVTISYVGFNDFVRSNQFLDLGQTKRISTQLSESTTALDEVVITAQAAGGVFSANKTGSETTINRRQIQTQPAASRSIADFVRLTPEAQITEGNDGFSVSFAGQNNRLNAIYIDGAISNDVFGLAGSGTNGGQTGANPFSVDAIESFQVQLAPFDVRIAGFAGGAISAVTRSGTNNWEGSTYYFLRNESLAGKTPPDLVGDGESREKLDDFTAQTYGFRVGGPIVKDKLFFFLNYERQDDETPQPFQFSNYTGDTDQAGIDNLRQFLINTYGYDPGGFSNNTRTLVRDNITARLDWNINDNHKLSFRYSWNSIDNLEARSSNNFNIGFINGSEFFESVTNTASLEWNAQFGNKFANSLILGYTRVRDDRDPSGSPFPTVDIRDGNGTISFGAEPFSTANLLDQDIFTITNNFEIYAGKHTITLGTHNEFASIKNLFFAFNFGDYTYNSVQDFINNENLDFYQRGYSLLPGTGIGDDSSGAAEFDVAQLGFYVQDEIQFTDNFRLSAGIRFDLPLWEDGIVNDDFNNRTIPILEAAGKDLQGARVGRGVSPILHVSPRVGFNWDVNGDRSTQVRGGFGIFTSRLPLVWPGGTYNNNGVTGGFGASFNIPGDITFNPDVNNQPVNVAPGTGGVGGNVDLFASGFRLPQVLKYSVGVDQRLPWWGLIASFDGIFNDNIQTVFYENLNIGDPVSFYEGADNRPRYSDSFGDLLDNTYGRVILASNTNAGSSYTASVTIRKPFTNGFAGSATYSYGNAFAIFDLTSSQNSSQWRNHETVNGKNSNLPTTRSDFAQGHRIVANVSYEHKWNDNVKSTIGLFYEGSQAQPFSYIYREGPDLLNDDSRDNALIYVPANQNEITLVERNGVSPEAQWQALNAFIEGNDYLRSRRGDYAERNGDRGPWSHVVDLKFLQDFSINAWGKKHTLQLTADIFNFTNLLNSDWGVRRFRSRKRWSDQNREYRYYSYFQFRSYYC
ncbi:TonB-dependent receptor [Leptobacterium flavescens]|uniref:TonB-dependent receptor n=1 Tax=Leptobacterium flavescens TaxID=472055 RepID=UPI00293BBE1C|nr:carboxypeptidase regulatory-like domain-containing protein [Leptobacterium flavescens]